MAEQNDCQQLRPKLLYTQARISGKENAFGVHLNKGPNICSDYDLSHMQYHEGPVLGDMSPMELWLEPIPPMHVD